jgi:hypothetical protein
LFLAYFYYEEFFSTMAINLKSVLVPVKRETSGKREAAAKSPIANRSGLAGVRFIRETANLGEDTPPPDDGELLRQAWLKSPERTVLALAEIGYATKEIAAKLGYKSDDNDFTKLLRDSQTLLKTEIASDLISQIPDEVMQIVVDADGVEHEVDIAAKLKKAVVNTLFDNKSMTIGFSAAKGAPVEVGFADLFNMTIEQVRKTKSAARVQYSRTFRTRDTGGAASGIRPLAPALAKLGVVAAEPKADDSTPATPAE